MPFGDTLNPKKHQNWCVHDCQTHFIRGLGNISHHKERKKERKKPPPLLLNHKPQTLKKEKETKESPLLS